MVYEVGFKISGWGFCNQKSRVQSHGIRAKGAWSVVWGVWTASQGPPFVGGANRCSLHCHLAKFRGLMYRVKYGAVIGLTKPSLEIVTGHIQKNAFCGPITAPYFTLLIKPRNFAK